MEFVQNVFGLRSKCETSVRIDGKVVVITGANTVIGKETAYQLSLRGAKIIIGCLDMKKAETAINDIKTKNSKADITALKLDLASLQSVRRFSKSVSEKVSNIDILINNAGVMMCPEWKTEDGFEMHFGTNYLGHFYLTHSLLPLLKKSSKARVVNVSSINHIVGQINFDNINQFNGEYNPFKAYAQSKLAMILWTKEMARRLGPNSNVKFYSLHPGVIRTDITRYVPVYIYYLYKWYLTSIEMGVQTTLYCSMEPDLDNESGFYYSDCRRVDSMVSHANDDKSASKLYDYTLELIKINKYVET